MSVEDVKAMEYHTEFWWAVETGRRLALSKGVPKESVF